MGQQGGDTGWNLFINVIGQSIAEGVVDRLDRLVGEPDHREFGNSGAEGLKERLWLPDCCSVGDHTVDRLASTVGHRLGGGVGVVDRSRQASGVESVGKGRRRVGVIADIEDLSLFHLVWEGTGSERLALLTREAEVVSETTATDGKKTRHYRHEFERSDKIDSTADSRGDMV
jgi:hypothetical protein